MAFDFDLAPLGAQRAGLVDQEGRPVDPRILPAVEFLLYPGAVGLAGLAVFVGDQGKVQIVLGLELVVLGDSILGDTDDRGFDFRKVGVQITEPASFGGSAGGVVFEIEIEHHRIAPEIRQLQRAAAVRGQGEVGGLVADFG